MCLFICTHPFIIYIYSGSIVGIKGTRIIFSNGKLAASIDTAQKKEKRKFLQCT